MTDFSLETICSTGLNSSITLSVSSGVVECQLLSGFNVPSSKQGQSGYHRVHPDRDHEQVGSAGVVKEAAYVSNCSGVHKRFRDVTCSCVLPYSDDVIIVFQSLCELSPSGFVQSDHLPGVLAHKRPTWDRFMSVHTPAPVLSLEHFQSVPHSCLYHAVRAGVAAGAKGVAFKDRRAVRRCSLL